MIRCAVIYFGASNRPIRRTTWIEQTRKPCTDIALNAYLTPSWPSAALNELPRAAVQQANRRAA